MAWLLGVLALAIRSRRRRRDQVEVAGLNLAAVPRGLLLHHFDLLIDDLAGETVDGDMNPVVLFAFDNEIVLQTGSIWLEVAGLGDHVDQ